MRKIFGALIFLIAIGTIVSFFIFRAHVESASRDWVDVGGGISWNEDLLLGPRRITIGGLPGVVLPDDLPKINSALHQINRLPVCDEISINCDALDLEGDRVNDLLRGTVFKHLCLRACKSDVDTLNKLIAECRCTKLTLIAPSLDSADLAKVAADNPTIEVLSFDNHRKVLYHRMGKSAVPATGMNPTNK